MIDRLEQIGGTGAQSHIKRKESKDQSVHVCAGMRHGLFVWCDREASTVAVFLNFLFVFQGSTVWMTKSYGKRPFSPPTLADLNFLSP